MLPKVGIVGKRWQKLAKVSKSCQKLSIKWSKWREWRERREKREKNLILNFRLFLCCILCPKLDLLCLIVKIKKKKLSYEASDFWWRLQTDLCTHLESVSYSELHGSTSMYLEVPQSTQKCLKVPRNTQKYFKVPTNNFKYLLLLQSIKK